MTTTQVRGAQMLPGTIVDSDVASANKDGTAATPSLRTLGTGALQACAGNDARLTSTGITANQLKGFINGLRLVYGIVSGIIVTPGNCRDSQDAAFMSLATSVTISSSSGSAVLGICTQALSGTCQTSSFNQTVTGTGTAFLTEFGTRAATGLISGAGTTITGVGTKFLSEVAVNDLIGTSIGARGYSQVIAIASDTSLTLNIAIPGGDPGGAAFNVIEQPTIWIGVQNAARILKITSNTSLTIVPNSSGTGSGLSATTGYPSVSGNWLLSVWLVSGGSGTSALLSTQRTTPWLPTGYTTSTRRIGSVLAISASPVAFTQSGVDNERVTIFQTAQLANSSRLLAGGVATAWTALSGANQLAPPSAVALGITMEILASASGGVTTYLRPRNLGDSAVTRALFAAAATSGLVSAPLWCDCDGAQCLDYVSTVATGGTYLDLFGYREYL